MADHSDFLEKQNLYYQVLQKFKSTIHRIAEAKRKAETFYNFYRKPSEQCPISDNCETGYDAVDVIETHLNALDTYATIITSAFEIFENHISAPEGDGKLLIVAEKTVMIFLSVQLKVESRREEIHEVIENAKVAERMKES